MTLQSILTPTNKPWQATDTRPCDSRVQKEPTPANEQASLMGGRILASLFPRLPVYHFGGRKDYVRCLETLLPAVIPFHTECVYPRQIQVHIPKLYSFMNTCIHLKFPRYFPPPDKNPRRGEDLGMRQTPTQAIFFDGTPWLHLKAQPLPQASHASIFTGKIG